jgi:flagellin
MVSGDLVLNGVLVGASLAEGDNVSFGDRDSANSTAVNYVGSSAIAKVSAINEVSSLSGVFATVDDTQVLGSTMTAAAATGSLIINGVETADFTTSTDAELSRQLVSQAINNISEQTGVRAVNTNDDVQGVKLVADDGRNITIEFNTLTTAETGLGAAATYVGTYSLHSVDGSDINIEHQVFNEDTAISTGLKIGSYNADKAIFVAANRTQGGAGSLDAGTLVINGINIAAALSTDDLASATSTLDGAETAITAADKASSAIAIAAAINKRTTEHGVTAYAEANVLRGNAAFDGDVATDTGSIWLNGVTFDIAASSQDAVIERINQYSGQTGVVARRYGDAMELVAEDGRDIAIALNGYGGDNASLGLGGVTIATSVDGSGASIHKASVRLESDKAFTLDRSNDADQTNFEALGFRTGTFGGTDTGMKIAEIDLSTQSGATVSITAIDAAIQDVANAQARSGAFQNRLDAIVSVLSESNENISASRSRILDTDYATETTALAKSQIVQQAATAMLAQANQQSQSVLALLQ